MTELDYLNEISTLKANNDNLTLVNRNLCENVRNTIMNFWCWFCSSDYRRDLNKADEGRKYADDFIQDLIKEVTEDYGSQPKE